jgi:hypothetical protein
MFRRVRFAWRSGGELPARDRFASVASMRPLAPGFHDCPA